MSFAEIIVLDSVYNSSQAHLNMISTSYLQLFRLLQDCVSAVLACYFELALRV